MTWTSPRPGVSVLGSVSLEVKGRPVPVGGALPRRLLAVLLASRGAVVSVDRLVEVVWGDEPPETAVSSLQTYVSRLRRLLPPSARLETSAPGYRLRLEPGTADVDRFEAALNEALGCLTDRPEAALARLDEALGLWQGDAFAEFRDEWWAHGEAARLEELRLHAREAHAEALLGLGRDEAAVSEARAVTADHPSRERAWRTLVLGLHRCGRQREALRGGGRLPGPSTRRLRPRPLQRVRGPRTRRRRRRPVTSNHNPPTTQRGNCVGQCDRAGRSSRPRPRARPIGCRTAGRAAGRSRSGGECARRRSGRWLRDDHHRR